MIRPLSLAAAALLATSPAVLARGRIHHHRTRHVAIAEPAPARPVAPPAAAPAPVSPPLVPATIAQVAPKPAPKPVPAPNPQAETDRTFLTQEIARANFARDLAELASARAENGQLRAHAQATLEERRSYDDALARFAESDGIKPSSLPDPSRQQQIARLQSIRGHLFDAAYIEAVRRINGEMLRAEQTEMVSSANSGLTQLLRQALPTQQRLAMRSADLSLYGQVSGRNG